VRLGGPERACELLPEAVALATRSGRTAVARRIHGVRRQHLEPWAGEPPVRDLDERLAGIL